MISKLKHLFISRHSFSDIRIMLKDFHNHYRWAFELNNYDSIITLSYVFFLQIIIFLIFSPKYISTTRGTPIVGFQYWLPKYWQNIMTPVCSIIKLDEIRNARHQNMKIHKNCIQLRNWSVRSICKQNWKEKQSFLYQIDISWIRF